MVCHCLLIETNQGLVLVDTGFGSVDIQNPKHLGRAFLALTNPTLKPSETAIEQVKALGFTPEDVTHIIPTHLDLDHAGGLADFPNATVHIHENEYQAAMNPRLNERARYRRLHFKHQPKWQRHVEGGDKWFGFDSIQAIEGLGADIALIPLHGHTRGHCGVAVKTDTGWLIHAGDAYFHHTEMSHGEMPAGLALFEKLVQINPAQRIENQLRLKDLATNPTAGVITTCAHDPIELERLQAAS